MATAECVAGNSGAPDTVAMIVYLLTSPLRVALGLPATYGMTLRNRFQQIGRWAGIYHGPIHYVIRAKMGRLGLTGQPIGKGA